MIKAVFSASPCDELESVYFSMMIFDCAKNTMTEMKALSSDVERRNISRPAIENRMLRSTLEQDEGEWRWKTSERVSGRRWRERLW